MKKIAGFFNALGDAFGLVILLGGLMLATNNLQAGRAGKQRRKSPAGAAKAARKNFASLSLQQ